MSGEKESTITSITLPAQDYQNLQRAQNGGFSGSDRFWKKQSGEDGFVTWALRVVFYLMRRGEFYQLLDKVKADWEKGQK